MSTALDAYSAQFAVHREWGQVADQAMRQLVDAGRPFTADDVRALVEPTGIEPTTKNAYGGLFQAWMHAGLIVPVGAKTSTAKKRRGGLIRIWQAAAKA